MVNKLALMPSRAGPHVLLVVGMRGRSRRLDHRLPATHNGELAVTGKLNCLAPGGNGFGDAFQ